MNSPAASAGRPIGRRLRRRRSTIVDGDIFQAVISRRFESPFTGSLLDAYRVLRTTNPSPYMVVHAPGRTGAHEHLPGDAGAPPERPARHLPRGRLTAPRCHRRRGPGAGGGAATRRKGALRAQHAGGPGRATTWGESRPSVLSRSWTT